MPREHGVPAVRSASISDSVLMFAFVGFILPPLVLLTQVILTIIGSLQASKGNFYRYPLTIRFLK